MSFSFEKKIFLLFSLVILGVLSTGYYTYQANTDVIEANKKVIQSRAILQRKESILSRFLDLIVNSRGYVLTGEASLVQNFNKESVFILKDLEQLHQLVETDSIQSLNVDALKQSILFRLNFSTNIISLKTKNETRLVVDAIASSNGTQSLEAVRTIANKIQLVEENKLKIANDANQLSLNHFNRAQYLTIIAILLFIVFTFYTIKTYLNQLSNTEQKLRQTLKETTSYKRALDAINLVAITDTKGTITYANENFSLLSKYSNEELVGQNHRLVNSGFHSIEFFNEMWSTISKGKVWKGEIKNKAKDGSYYWVDTAIVPFLNENGKPLQYMAIRADITERKKAEDNLLSANKELESFSYSVSHDLRAPLRAINGYAQIMLEDYGPQLDDEGNRILQIVMNSGKKMGQLIDDLLEFSRLGKKELQLREVDMMELVQDVIKEFVKPTDAYKVVWQIDKLLPAIADQSVIRNVWINLILNGLKYSKNKEKATIEIGSEKNGETVTYFIKDNGAGFDMQYANKLFGVFQRLHSNEEFEGTGVGLAIVQRVVTRHGGRVWAEGKVGEGASFYFTLKNSI